MTRDELVLKLDGVERDTFDILMSENRQPIKESGLVVVYGASDDLMEFDGAFRDEVNAWEGGTAYLTEAGIFYNTCENDECQYVKKERSKCKTIKAIWYAPDQPAWTFETEIPHSEFNIMDNGEIFCRGIIFEVLDLKTR